MNKNIICSTYLSSVIKELSVKPISLFQLLNSSGRKVSGEKFYQAINVTKYQIKGIYAFWWIGKNKYEFYRKVAFKGPRNKADNLLKVTWKPFVPELCNYQCLYVGKTTNIIQRIGMHLVLQTDDWYDKPEYIALKNNNRIVKRTTQCQLRAGLEHLFQNVKEDHLEILKNEVGITFLPIDDMVERFYLEDLAIGYFRPWFNLDSER